MMAPAWALHRVDRRSMLAPSSHNVNATISVALPPRTSSKSSLPACSFDSSDVFIRPGQQINDAKDRITMCMMSSKDLHAALSKVKTLDLGPCALLCQQTKLVCMTIHLSRPRNAELWA